MTLVNRARAQRLSRANAFGTAPFVSEGRVDTLRAMIAAGLTERMRQKWEIVLSRSPEYVVKGPVRKWAL